jgi:transposase
MINLTDEERAEVDAFLRRGKANARTNSRARILLKSAEGWTIHHIAETFWGSPATVSNVRRRYREGGAGVLKDKEQAKRRHTALLQAHLSMTTGTSPVACD